MHVAGAFFDPSSRGDEEHSGRQKGNASSGCTAIFATTDAPTIAFSDVYPRSSYACAPPTTHSCCEIPGCCFSRDDKYNDDDFDDEDDNNNDGGGNSCANSQESAADLPHSPEIVSWVYAEAEAATGPKTTTAPRFCHSQGFSRDQG